MKKLLLSLVLVSAGAVLAKDCSNTCNTCKPCKKECKEEKKCCPACPKPPKCERDKVVTTCEAPKKEVPCPACPTYTCPAGTRTVNN